MSITLTEFFGMVSSGVVRTDRSGKFETNYLLDQVPQEGGEELVLVTQQQDPIAWSRARHAYDPLRAGAEPQYVAVSLIDRQVIYTG